METYELIAPCHFGLEAVLKKEIYDLGYEITKVEDGRVTFEGDAEAVCRACGTLSYVGNLRRYLSPLSLRPSSEKDAAETLLRSLKTILYDIFVSSVLPSLFWRQIEYPKD